MVMGQTCQEQSFVFPDWISMQIESSKQNCPKPTDFLLFTLVKTINGNSEKSVRTETLRMEFLFFSVFIYNPIWSVKENGQF